MTRHDFSDSKLLSVVRNEENNSLLANAMRSKGAVSSLNYLQQFRLSVAITDEQDVLMEIVKDEKEHWVVLSEAVLHLNNLRVLSILNAREDDEVVRFFILKRMIELINEKRLEETWKH